MLNKKIKALFLLVNFIYLTPRDSKSLKQAVKFLHQRKKINKHVKSNFPLKFTFGNTEQILDIVKPYLPNDPIILEAGAFDGNDSIKMSQYWPNGFIYSFEPIPDLYNAIQAKIGENLNMHCTNCALGDEDKVVDFYTFTEVKNPTNFTGAGSVLPPVDEFPFQYFTQLKDIIRVPMVSLDSWTKKNNIKRIDMMWLDMQGYELNMLKAAPHIIKNVKVIYVEVEFKPGYKDQFLAEDVVLFLKSLNFKIIAQDYSEKEHWYGNMIFVNENVIK